ncbi:dimer_Tnp_hAT domain-containing protein [Trichonephila clavipes]|nr:dimer_Tnp_hAT domain-containing protein [Trichonephila clavipes]
MAVGTKDEQHFWRKWSSEYLNRLQQRPKWCKGNVSFKEGISKPSDNSDSLKWHLARISKLHPGKDNIVRVVTLKEFSARFSQFKELSETFKFIMYPDVISFDKLNLSQFDWLEIEVQLIDFQSSSIWIQKFIETRKKLELIEAERLTSNISKNTSNEILETWNSIPDAFNCLKKLAYTRADSLPRPLNSFDWSGVGAWLPHTVNDILSAGHSNDTPRYPGILWVQCPSRRGNVALFARDRLRGGLTTILQSTITSKADVSCTPIGPSLLKSRPPLQTQASNTTNIRVPDRGLKAAGAA